MYDTSPTTFKDTSITAFLIGILASQLVLLAVLLTN
jgi:hypothetical protein